MQGLGFVLLVASPATLLIASRLWRGRRLSDRTMTILIVGITPALVFAFGLIQGSSVPFTLGTTALVLLPGLALYRNVVELIREQHSLTK